MDTTYHLSGGFKPTAKRNADIDGPDFFPTPAWATHALIDNEQFTGDIWEPACGNGAMAKVLSETGNMVRASDLFDRGYGDAGVDFLEASDRCQNVVTNPPYHSAEAFLEKGLEIADRKVALLLRLAFLEGATRAQTIFHRRPPARVWVFSQRITFYSNGVKTGGSGTTAYAWFVWDKVHAGPTELEWFKPGYKPKGRRKRG